jgi:hypothetical protein
MLIHEILRVSNNKQKCSVSSTMAGIFPYGGHFLGLNTGIMNSLWPHLKTLGER